MNEFKLEATQPSSRKLKAFYTQELVQELQFAHPASFRVLENIGVSVKLQQEYERIGYRIPRRFSRQKRQKLIKKLKKCWSFWELVDIFTEEIRKEINQKFLENIQINH